MGLETRLSDRQILAFKTLLWRDVKGGFLVHDSLESTGTIPCPARVRRQYLACESHPHQEIVAAMRVLLADSHQDVRWALRTFLTERLAVLVVAEVANVAELMCAVERFKPDLILVDWDLPGWTGTTHLATLKSAQRPAKVIILCQRTEMEAGALAAGADGVVSKSAPPEHLLAALEALNWSDPARDSREP